MMPERIADYSWWCPLASHQGKRLGPSWVLVLLIAWEIADEEWPS